MTPLERRGLRNLTASRPKPGPMSKWIVRIYYRSAEGEMLCVDSELLSWQAAGVLERQHKAVSHGGWKNERKPPCSDAVDAEMFRAVEAEEEHRLKYSARRVTLPHQQSPLGAERGLTPCERNEK